MRSPEDLRDADGRTLEESVPLPWKEWEHYAVASETSAYYQGATVVASLWKNDERGLRIDLRVGNISVFCSTRNTWAATWKEVRNKLTEEQRKLGGLLAELPGGEVNFTKEDFKPRRILPKITLIPRRILPKITIIPSPRPEDDSDPGYPSYHEMLNHLCDELGVPGSQTFYSAVAWVKERMGR